MFTDVQIADKIWFLDVSVRVFLEDITIWIGRLSKEDLPSPMWVDILQFVEGSSRIERWRKVEKEKFLSLSLEAGTSIFFCPHTSESLVLRPSNSGTDTSFYSSFPHISTDSQVFRLTELDHQHSLFSGLQMKDGGTSQPPYLHEPISRIKLPLVLFFWRMLTNSLSESKSKGRRWLMPQLENRQRERGFFLTQSYILFSHSIGWMRRPRCIG